MTQGLRLSVIVPVRDMPQHIGACVESIMADLSDGDELLVVDDGSRDDTVHVATEAGARVIANTGRPGPYGARNLGAAEAKGEGLLFVDGRCRALPGLLDAHRRLLATDGFAMSCTEVEIVRGESLASRIAVAQDGFRTDFKVKGTVFDFYPTANLGVRCDAFDAVSGFRDVRSGADADLCWRIQLAGLGKIGVDPLRLMRWVPRDRLRSLFEQSYRYGRSAVYLDRFYADVRARHAAGRDVTEAANVARPTDDRVAEAGARVVNLPFRFGRLRGRWEHRQVEADPSLTDA